MPLALVGAIFMALTLFYAMHYMISQGSGKINKSEDYSVVDFVRLKRESETRIKKRVIPKKPPLPKEPPPPPQLSVAQDNNVAMPQLKMDMPRITSSGVTGGPFMGQMASGAGAAVGDGELIALVKIAPRYPRKAAIAKKEGWVKVEFIVTELGTVKDVKVLDAKPRRLFERAAKKAILKWKFKPRIVDGKAVPRKAIQTIEFKLEG
ncbi:MAG: energy transducer TonB [Gammaproteobacteria bacterium]|nr:energy transducer TonB [Gammaproteobacteria bacterium]MBT6552523.1 energy transducer TonB [Gammaproteobacteria bacterium]